MQLDYEMVSERRGIDSVIAMFSHLDEPSTDPEFLKCMEAIDKNNWLADVRDSLVVTDYIEKGLLEGEATDILDARKAFFEKRKPDSYASCIMLNESTPIATLSVFSGEMPFESYMPIEAQEMLYEALNTNEICEIGSFATNKAERGRITYAAIHQMMGILSDYLGIQEAFPGECNPEYTVICTTPAHSKFYKKRFGFTAIEGSRCTIDQLNGAEAIFSYAKSKELRMASKHPIQPSKFMSAPLKLRSKWFEGYESSNSPAQMDHQVA